MSNRKGLWLPDEILGLTNLSLAERMVLGQVCYRAAKNQGLCSDTNAEIGGAIHIHFMTVSAALATLTGSNLLNLGGGPTRCFEPRARLVQLYLRADEEPLTPTAGMPSYSSVMVTATASASGLGSVNGLPSAADLPSVNDLAGVSQRLIKGKSTAYVGSANDLPLYIGIENYKKFLKDSKSKKGEKTGAKSSVAVEETQFIPPAGDQTSPQVAAAPSPSTEPGPAEPEPQKPVVPKPVRRDPFFRKSDLEKCNVPFSLWLARYDYKANQESAKTAWLNLTDEERQKAWEHTPDWVASRPDKFYRGTPQSYLEEKKFNNEIAFKPTRKSATTSVNQTERRGGRQIINPNDYNDDDE